KAFEGDFHQHQTPGGRYIQNPEEHRGGLKIGSIRNPDNTLRFDCDELAIYDRVLLAKQIKKHFEDGRPTQSATEQEQAHRAFLQKQTRLAGVTMEIPSDYFGYFPAGKPVRLTVGVPAAAQLSAPLTVDVTLHDGNQKTFYSGTKNLDFTGSNDAQLIWDLPFPKVHGLYQIDIALKDSTGAVCVTKSYPVAATLPVAPMSERPVSSPLAGHGIVRIHNEDIAIGGRFERVIPWCPKQADGKPGFQYSDRDVSLAFNAGLEVLFCISPRFDMGQVDLSKVETDPREWENWIRAFVEHYKGRIKYWEILNEPNAGMHIKPSQYVAMLKSAYRVIKEVDPDAKIVGLCGVTIYPQWTEDVLKAGGGGYFDILSFHNYLGSSPISAWRRDRKIERTRAILRKYLDKEVPIWNSESGIMQAPRQNGQPLTEDQLLAKYRTHARQENGITLVAANAVTMATEHVGACWQTQSILLDCALGVERYFMLMGSSTFYLSPNASNGCPTQKGLAYAALASVLTQSKSIDLLPISSSTSAGVLVTSLEGKHTAALFADVPTTRCFTVNKSGTYLGMDYLGNPLQWEAAGNLLTVTFGMEPIYIFDVPADLSEAPFLNVATFPALVSPGDDVEGMLSVANLLLTPMTAELKITSLKSTVSFMKEITLEAGKQADVKFRFKAGALPRGNHALIVSLLQNGKQIASTEYAFASEGIAQGIPLAPHAIKLDGESSDWQGITGETADVASHVVIGRPPVGYYEPNAWQGPKDLSFTVKTAWRPNDGVYFFIDVTDDAIKTVPAGTVRRAFLQDALEFFFDGRPLKSQTPIYTFGAEQLVVVPAVGDTVEPCLFKSFARKGESIDVEFVGKRSATGYVMEGRIRPKENAPFKLEAGARLGLDFVFDDAADAAMARKTQMALHGIAENSNDTSHFGRYRLLGHQAPAVTNLLRNTNLSQSKGQKIPSWRFSKTVDNATDDIAAQIKGGVKEVDGKRVLWICASSEAQSHSMWDQTIPATAETAYAVSFRLKGKIQGKKKWCGGGGSVFFLGKKGKWLGSHPIGRMAATLAGDWGTFKANIITPAGTKSMGFRFGVLSCGVEGTADFYCTDMVVSQQP
ncbi:MAG: hypothetical protein JKX85_12915, partial [Phycisphaeraceae bacterium]|nr:hypothetical protein [Phycisphaeraceae bacterium]